MKGSLPTFVQIKPSSAIICTRIRAWYQEYDGLCKRKSIPPNFRMTPSEEQEMPTVDRKTRAIMKQLNESTVCTLSRWRAIRSIEPH
jgi:hypothetical protein